MKRAGRAIAIAVIVAIVAAFLVLTILADFGPAFRELSGG